MSLSSVFQEPRHTSVTLSGMWWRVEPAQIQFTHLFLWARLKSPLCTSFTLKLCRKTRSQKNNHQKKNKKFLVIIREVQRSPGFIWYHTHTHTHTHTHRCIRPEPGFSWGAPNYSWFYVTRFGRKIRSENILRRNQMNFGGEGKKKKSLNRKKTNTRYVQHTRPRVAHKPGRPHQDTRFKGALCSFRGTNALCFHGWRHKLTWNMISHCVADPATPENSLFIHLLMKKKTKVLSVPEPQCPFNRTTSRQYVFKSAQLP